MSEYSFTFKICVCEQRRLWQVLPQTLLLNNVIRPNSNMLAHIRVCIGDLIFPNRWAGILVLLEIYLEHYMHLNLP